MPKLLRKGERILARNRAPPASSSRSPSRGHEGLVHASQNRTSTTSASTARDDDIAAISRTRDAVASSRRPSPPRRSCPDDAHPLDADDPSLAPSERRRLQSAGRVAVAVLESSNRERQREAERRARVERMRQSLLREEEERRRREQQQCEKREESQVVRVKHEVDLCSPPPSTPPRVKQEGETDRARRSTPLNHRPVLNTRSVPVEPATNASAVSVSCKPDPDSVKSETPSKVRIKAEPEVIQILDDDDDFGNWELLNGGGQGDEHNQIGSDSSRPDSHARPPPREVPSPPPRPTPLDECLELARDAADPSRGVSNGPRASKPRTPRRAGLEDREVRVRDEPWPYHFLELEKVFQALNTVYAFCSARKHLATTYDTIKSSVETLLSRPLEIFDIAQIKSLCPDLVTFAYVDHDELSSHLDGPSSASAVQPLTWKDRAQAKQAMRDDIFSKAVEAIEQAEERSGQGSAAADGSHTRRRRSERQEYVLLFEFNDGTLQGPKATARGQRHAGMRRGPRQESPANRPKYKPLNSMPSPASMRRLIEKRNFKFEQAVLELLSACKAKDEDPVMLLVSAAEDHVPLNPETATRPSGDTPKKRRIRLEHLMTHPEDRPSVASVIEEMKTQPWWKDQIVPGGYRTVEARPARYEQLTFALSQSLINALWATQQIEEFYMHQAEALNALDDGKHVIVSTSTSSGKSLIYQMPVLRALEERFASTAMYIFPTKALAQDQRRSLADLIANCEGLEDAIVATYDGDTPREMREQVRESASVIFTNPDMLHQSILPNETAWRRYLRNLRFVVVDELHTYNGLFGAHVSFIMRRLRRICAALGNRRVQFISCSATVANPAEHMRTLFGVEDVEVVTEDGSPAGQKEWVIWNPPLIDADDPAQGRVSAYAETSKVFRHLVERGIRTIVFTKVRRTCEIVISQIRNDLLVEGRHDVANRVMAYRSGYSPEDRRKIEQDMFKGQLLGIVATSALELGIDIGSLDAVIMLGFPYSISSLRQQAGRAGRRQKDSLAVLIGDPFPADQYYMANPNDIFEQPDSALTVDLENDFVLESHLQCAAEEMPIHPDDDAAFFGNRTAALCANRLERDEAGFYHCRSELRPNPAREVAIRGARQLTYAYIDDTPGRRGGARVMEEVELDRAIFEAFEGAVFYHQGLSFVCTEISHDTRIARMVQADVNFHTRPRDHTDTDAVETHRIRALRGTSSRAYYGHVRIVTRVWGYFKVDRRANILDAVDVDCPPFVRDTQGLWLDVPTWLVGALTEKTINASAAIHAAEHALLSLTPMFVVTLAGDVRTECKIAEREYARRASGRKRPARLIFYDTPGQNGGVCAKAFEHLDGLIRIAIAVIEACPCIAGCPGCVTSNTCAHANVVTSKVGALGVLRGLVGLEPFDPELPQQNEAGHAESTLGGQDSLGHTIQEATPVRIAPGLGNVEVEHHEERLPPSLEQALRRYEAWGASAGGNVGEGAASGSRPDCPPQGKSLLFEE